jgi:hypothetical protein
VSPHAGARAVAIAVLAIAAACVAGGAVFACAPADVTIAHEIPLEAGAADAGAHADAGVEAGVPGCSSNEDCAPTAFCEKPTCDAGLGTCAVRSLDCSEAGVEQECGCDGVGYWNDCLRRRDGIASFTPGFCRNRFAGCGEPGDPACPVLDAVCGRVEFGGQCDRRGTCWVLPDQCDPDAGGPSFVPCGPMMPMPPPPPACTNLCSALRSQVPQVRAPPGVCE